MLIKYKTVERDSHEPYEEKYEFLEAEFCCEEMEEQWGRDGAVKWGEADSILNTLPRPTIMIPRHYPEGCHEKYVPIDSCPWCADDMVSEEVERVREVKSEKTVERSVTERKEVPVD